MALNRHASGEDVYGPFDPYTAGTTGSSHADGGFGAGTALATGPAQETHDSYASYAQTPAYFGPELAADEPYGEWNPSAETLRPVRGRHRVARQRGGTVARSRAVLGVGVMAAVGAGGMATANEGGAPGVSDAAEKVKSVGTFAFGGGDDAGQESQAVITAAPLTSAGLAVTTDGADAAASQGAPGEALRARILAQADQQDALAAAEQRDAALDHAIAGASEAAAAQAEQERVEEKEREKAEAEKKRKAEEEKERKAEEERLRKLQASFAAPLSNYTLSASYGQAGAMWSSGYHTGLDFAAPAGTPIKNVHTGTVQEAAWAGSYGYRVIVEQEDGTEISYSHLSSMSVVAGQKIVTGDAIGNVGSTGHSSGPHLHLEVRPGGGGTVDPLSWMRGNGIQI